MKQDEFIKEFKQYFGTDIGEIDRFSSRTIGDLDLFDFINHLLSKKPSVSDEARANDLAKWHTETHSGEGDFFDELEKTYKEAYLKGLTESKSLPKQDRL